ncbi:MAG: hypothetical protein C7B44_03730 [Sulfobacillus thermosulfidooxidans]|nr:MAG: hypothetical protein C7B44_03730 [Sulfobacillus thermosulfidooxidans]
MSEERHHDTIGELMDRAMADGMGLYFKPDGHPKKALKRRARVRQIFLSAAAASIAGLLILPQIRPAGQSHTSTGQRTLSAPALSASVKHVISQLSNQPVQVMGMSPVYATYPMAVPTGHALTLSGKFSVGNITGTSLVLKLDNRRRVLGGTLFNQGVPVYDFVGNITTGGDVINPHPSATPLAGTWVSGLPTPISSFAAAGSYIYLTHNNTWAVLHGPRNAYWAASPGHASPNIIDTISALPSNPQSVLLAEEAPSGLSSGYVSNNGGRSWQPWTLGQTTFSNVVAMGHQYWAIINGTLQTSFNGMTWRSMMALNTNRWQVEDFAINPSNAQQIAVALVPISGTGIGPVLESLNGGKTWQELPHFPALGAAPSSMVMSPAGGISALVNLTDPVLVCYSPHHQKWTAIAVPASPDQVGIGQLAASPNGDLLYGSPTGSIYRWVKATGQWQSISAPTTTTSAPYPLEAIGNHQILAGYGNGWSIFVVSNPLPSKKPS